MVSISCCFAEYRFYISRSRVQENAGWGCSIVAGVEPTHNIHLLTDNTYYLVCFTFEAPFHLYKCQCFNFLSLNYMRMVSYVNNIINFVKWTCALQKKLYANDVSTMMIFSIFSTTAKTKYFILFLLDKKFYSDNETMANVADCHVLTIFYVENR